MKSSYIPMLLLFAVIALAALFEKDKSLDHKLIEINSNELRVAPVAPSEAYIPEEEVVFKCKKEVRPKAYEPQPVEKANEKK